MVLRDAGGPFVCALGRRRGKEDRKGRMDTRVIRKTDIDAAVCSSITISLSTASSSPHSVSWARGAAASPLCVS